MMDRTLELTSERLGSFVENYNRLREIGFYSTTCARVLLNFDIRTKKLEKEIADLKDLKISLSAFERFYEALDSEEKSSIRTNLLYSFNVFDFKQDINSIDKNLSEAQDDLNNLDETFWRSLLFSIAEERYKWAGPFDYELKNDDIEFGPKFETAFIIENIIDYRKIIDRSIDQLGVIYAYGFFNRMEFKNKTLKTKEAYETNLFDDIYYSDYKNMPNELNRSKLKKVLSMIYYATRAGENDFEDFDEVINNTIKEVETLIDNNKRIAFEFEGCKIKINKTAPTTIVFSNVLAYVINEVNK